MRALAVLALFSVMALAEPAAAQGQLVSSLTLERGQAASLRFDESGAPMLIEQRAAGPLSDFAAAVASDNAAGAYSYAVGGQSARIPMDKYPEPPPLEPGVLRVAFAAAPGTDHTILVIENGYDQALRYRARITVAGSGPEPSDVCLVKPTHHTFEHWPYLIERIELLDFRTQPWREGDPVPCV